VQTEKHDPMERLMLRGTEVAQVLGISRARSYRWMQSGILPTVRRGRAVRVPRAALMAWIERNTQCDGGEAA
jgi:excisionase family DNA binding protein